MTASVVEDGILPRQDTVRLKGLDQSVHVTKPASCNGRTFTQAPKSNELNYRTLNRL
jgi:hypothetical protein